MMLIAKTNVRLRMTLRLNPRLVWRSGAVAIGLVSALAAYAFPGETLPASVGLRGFGPIGASTNPSISADGRYVAFESAAADLVAGDQNGRTDVFVTDRQTGQTTLVSMGLLGIQGNSESVEPSISADGRYVAFESYASNLISADSNGAVDIFVRDLISGTTTRVSVGVNSSQADRDSYAPSISADGRYVAFTSLATTLMSGGSNGWVHVYIRDRVAGTTKRVSVNSSGEMGTSSSYESSISADGQKVAFYSYASNLVPDDTNNRRDVFVRDIGGGTTKRVSVNSAGLQANNDSTYASISADGKRVAFESSATNLVDGDTNGWGDIFVRDLNAGVTTRVSLDSAGGEGNDFSANPAISANGQYVVFQSFASDLVPTDTNGYKDIFVHDLNIGTTTVMSLSSANAIGNSGSYRPATSGDGGVIVFDSYSTNLGASDINRNPDVFARDRNTATTTQISTESADPMGNSNSTLPSVSQNGRYVVFASDANNLVAGDTNEFADIFMRDMITGTTTRINVDSAGNQANDRSYQPTISSDGRYVAYGSWATNLVAGDSNQYADVFVYDRVTKTTVLASVSSAGLQCNSTAFSPSLSADGRFVAFGSGADNLVAGDTSIFTDVFVRDMVAGTTVVVSVNSAGELGNSNSESPAISADGKVLAFYSYANNLVPGDTNNSSDIFVRNLATNTLMRVSVDSAGLQGNYASFSPSISADGRLVAFESTANNLVAGDTNGSGDIFLRDINTGKTIRLSVSSTGAEANNYSTSPKISGNGQFVAFGSGATNLVAGDTNGSSDVFVRNLATNTLSRASVDSAGGQANGNSSTGAITADGRFMVFSSYAGNLSTLGKGSYIADIFLREMKLANVISGKITAPGFTGGWSKTWVELSLAPTSGGDPIPISFVKLLNDGSYSFSTGAQGSYRILARIPGSLWKALPGSVSLGAATLEHVDFVLRLGDCDGDNYVGSNDYLILNAAFDTSVADAGFDARADLNGDGYVGTDDYLILNENFDNSGD